MKDCPKCQSNEEGEKRGNLLIVLPKVPSALPSDPQRVAHLPYESVHSSSEDP